MAEHPAVLRRDQARLRRAGVGAGRGGVNMMTSLEIILELKSLTQKSKIRFEYEAFVSIHAYPEGKWAISVLGDPHDSERFVGKTPEEAIYKAEAWLSRRPETEINLTLGLTADGKFQEAAQ